MLRLTEPSPSCQSLGRGIYGRTHRFFWFALAWIVMNVAFAKLVGRPMNFGEGIIYPIVLMFGLAIIIGKLGPSREERLAKDIQEYNRLSEKINVNDARLNLLNECIRQRRTSDPDCQQAATGTSNR